MQEDSRVLVKERDWFPYCFMDHWLYERQLDNKLEILYLHRVFLPFYESYE